MNYEPLNIRLAIITIKLMSPFVAIFSRTETLWEKEQEAGRDAAVSCVGTDAFAANGCHRQGNQTDRRRVFTEARGQLGQTLRDFLRSAYRISTTISRTMQSHYLKTLAVRGPCRITQHLIEESWPDSPHPLSWRHTKSAHIDTSKSLFLHIPRLLIHSLTRTLLLLAPCAWSNRPDPCAW